LLQTTEKLTALSPYWKLARTSQYIKNAFIFLPLFFGHKLNEWHAFINVSAAALSFCLAASSVYVVNDFADLAEDRNHPVKRLRPLASGALGRFQALFFLAFLLTGSAVTALMLENTGFLVILLSYLMLNMAYCFYLKHIAIVDIICIAVGFVLRVLAGGIVADVPISHWIITLTFLLALFLAFAKRRDDCFLSSNGNAVRRCIGGYNLEYISTSMAVMASVIIVSYILYTVSPETTQKHGTENLYITTVWVIIGLLRYMQLVFVMGQAGSPTQVVLRDNFLQIIIFLWLLTFYLLFDSKQLNIWLSGL
jgi:4-hydroxybenzoate polyprenyltransferase